MVCKKCEKKLGAVATSDPFKAKNAKTAGGEGKKKIGGTNKLLQKKNRFNPMSTFSKCKICKQKVHQSHSRYCQSCAYKIGICSMCGKQVTDTTNKVQRSV